MDLGRYIATCEKALLRSRHALEYLDGRGISLDAIKAWHIGYDAGNGIRGMAGRIVLPLLDYNYNPISVTGRRLPGGWGPKYYHLPFHKSRWLYGLHTIRFDFNFNIPIIVEGHFSAIQLTELGWPAYAVMGSTLSLWQAGHLAYIAAMLGQKQPYKFILFPDKDKLDSADEWNGTLSRIIPTQCLSGEYPLMSPRDCDPDWLAVNESVYLLDQLQTKSSTLSANSSEQVFNLRWEQQYGSLDFQANH